MRSSAERGTGFPSRSWTNIDYSRVSFCDSSIYDDSLLRPLLCKTENSRLVVHHCHKSSVISVLSTLLALCRCARVSSFLFECSSFKLTVIFLPMTSIKKTEKKKNSKQLTLHSFLMSSEPLPGPSSTKQNFFIDFFQLSVQFSIYLIH